MHSTPSLSHGTVTVVEGGLEIHNDAGNNSTLIANACVVVSLDIA